MRDELTGAFARAVLPVRLAEELSRAERQKSEVSLIFLDIDYFKSVNDAFGHSMGDRVLREVARTLDQNTRMEDSLFRYGGDEFVLLLPGADRNALLEFIDRLREVIQGKPLPQLDPPISITVSGGSATYPHDGTTLDALFDVADRRHYAAKRMGRGVFVTQDDELGTTPTRLQAPDRLIGRDEAVQRVKMFLDALNDEGRASLHLQAKAWLGQEYVHEHIVRLGRLRGFLVWQIPANHALSHRLYGCLYESRFTGIELSPVDDHHLLRVGYLDALCQEKGASGWLILIEDWDSLDEGTRTLVENIMLSNSEVPTGMVFATRQKPIWETVFPWNVQPFYQIVLGPLSESDFLGWIRLAMHWDPPHTLVEWLHRSLEGKASLLQPALHHLIDNGFLMQVEEKHWVVSEECYHHPLQERLLSELNPPANLPPLTDLFVGRAREIQAIKESLKKGRVVSLVAPGGMGKTRLGLQIAAEMNREFPHGVYFVSLENVTQSRLLPLKIAEAVGIPIAAQSTPEDAVCQALSNKRLLLVLDNFDHLAPSDTFISYLMEHTALPRVLITTRVSFPIPAGTLLQLDGLACADDTALTMSVLPAEAPAVELFIHKIRINLPDYQPKDGELSELNELCRLVNGSPLGLEYLAAWANTLPVSEIAMRLKGHLDSQIADREQPDLASQTQSIQGIFHTVWNMLAETEQQHLARLGMFPGDFSADAAHHIAGTSVFFLNSLNQHALLWKYGQNRYRLHPLFKNFLMAHLQTLGDVLEATTRRFISYYAQWAEMVVEQIEVKGDFQAQQMLLAEYDNLRRAWDLACESRIYSELYPLLYGLHLFYEHHGWFVEALSTFGELVADLEQWLDQHAAGEQEKLVLGWAKLFMGKHHFHVGTYEEAKNLVEAAVTIFEQWGAPIPLLRAIDSMVTLLRVTGEIEASYQLVSRQIQLAEQTGEYTQITRAYSNCALLAYQTDNFGEAERYWLKGLELHRKAHNEIKVISTLNNLGNAVYEQGNYEAARSYLEQCLPAAEALQGRTLLGAILDSYAKVLVAMGEYTEAQRHMLRGIEICLEVDAVPLGLEILNNYGRLLALNGLQDRAYTLWRLILRHPRLTFTVRRDVEKYMREFGFEVPEEELKEIELRYLIHLAGIGEQVLIPKRQDLQEK